MRELLIINPNTSVAVSALLHSHIQAHVAPQAHARCVTARFGAPYIADEAGYAVASHAVLDAWAAGLAQGPTPDAVLIGCFGDPGLLALRESSPVPVTGLAEASFIEAALHGRFAIVTGGKRWGPMLHRLAQVLGHGPALAGVHTLVATGAELAANPAVALALLTQACRDAVRQFDAQAIILGGAALAGMASAIQPSLGVPLIDSVLAGARWALQPRDTPERPSAGFDISWHNVSPELLALGLNP